MKKHNYEYLKSLQEGLKKINSHETRIEKLEFEKIRVLTAILDNIEQINKEGIFAFNRV